MSTDVLVLCYSCDSLVSQADLCLVLGSGHVAWPKCTFQLTQMQLLIYVLKVANLEVVQPWIESSQAFCCHLRQQEVV